MSLTDAGRAAMVRWLADGRTEIGIFENKALDSADLGRRVAIPFEKGALDTAEIGLCRAPDMPNLIGWKYVLVAKCITVEGAEEELAKANHVDAS
jgi:hypothetical protein